MNIRRFEASDYPMISRWYTGRNLIPPKAEWLPEIGFVVKDVAAGFVYNAEGKLALLEGYITNFHAPRIVRDKALDLITASLLEEARCPRVFASTGNTAIIKRAKKLGFSVREHRTFLSKEL